MLNNEQLAELQATTPRPVAFKIERLEMAFGPDLVMSVSFELSDSEQELLDQIETVLERCEDSTARTWLELQNQSHRCEIAKGLIQLACQGAFELPDKPKVLAFPNNLPTSLNVASLSRGISLCSGKMRDPWRMASTKMQVVSCLLEQLLKLK
jgi:hypothetical protein